MFEVRVFSSRPNQEKRTTDEHGSTRIGVFRAKPPRRKVFQNQKNPNPFFLCVSEALRESLSLKDEATGQDARATVARGILPATCHSHVSREICRWSLPKERWPLAAECP